MSGSPESREARLSDLLRHEADSLLRNVYTEEGCRVWWAGKSRFFDGRTADEVWRSGGEEEVLRLIHMLMDGAFA